jgi:hypothetical protein
LSTYILRLLIYKKIYYEDGGKKLNMAQLKACKTCTKEVAKSAKVCPHCGAKLKMGFFKKSILGLVGFIVLIVIISSLGGNDDGTATSGDAATASTTPDKEVAVELSNEGVSSDVNIIVNGFETKDKVGDNEFSTAIAQGIFQVVEVTLTNNQKDAITIDSNSFTLLDDQQREFTYSSEAQMALMSSLGDKQDSFFLQKLNPGLSSTGYIVFDVPKDAKGFILEASGGMTGKKIQLKVE